MDDVDRQKFLHLLHRIVDNCTMANGEIAGKHIVLYTTDAYGKGAWTIDSVKIKIGVQQNVICNMRPSWHDRFTSGKTNSRFFYELDGDMELVVLCSNDGTLSPARDLSDTLKVLLQKRQITWCDHFKELIPVAVKLHRDNREALLWEDGILGAEGDYTIVVPKEMVADNQRRFHFSYMGHSISTQQLSYEQALYFAREMQARLKKDWVETTLVCRMFKDKETTTSRSGKTARFHQVRAGNPVAGYAEWVLERTDVTFGEQEDKDVSLLLELHNPNNVNYPQQVFRIAGRKEFGAFLSLMQDQTVLV